MPTLQGVSPHTAFGAPWSDPAHAVSVLRALAWARQVPLSDLDDCQAAACVLAAHLWCTAAGRSSLDHLAGLTDQAAVTASAIACAAAGQPIPPVSPPEPARVPAHLLDSLLRESECALEWLEGQDCCAFCARASAASLLRAGSWPAGVQAALLCEPEGPHQHSCVAPQSGNCPSHG